MVHGTIVQYLKVHPDASRSALVGVNHFHRRFYQLRSGIRHTPRTHVHPFIWHGPQRPERGSCPTWWTLLRTEPAGFVQTNVLIDETGAARLADFGLSTVIHSTLAFSSSTNSRGTVRWMSPELHEDDTEVNSAQMTPLQLGIAADVWAWALVVWEVRFQLSQSRQSILSTSARDDRFIRVVLRSITSNEIRESYSRSATGLVLSDLVAYMHLRSRMKCGPSYSPVGTRILWHGQVFTRQRDCSSHAAHTLRLI